MPPAQAGRRACWRAASAPSAAAAALAAAALMLALTLALAPHAAAAQDARAKPTCVQLDMPPRFQWSENAGYCGETSVQMAALYYGAWISQYVARAQGGGTQEDGALRFLLVCVLIKGA